jgi:hypothetical protein
MLIFWKLLVSRKLTLMAVFKPVQFTMNSSLERTCNPNPGTSFGLAPPQFLIDKDQQKFWRATFFHRCRSPAFSQSNTYLTSLSRQSPHKPWVVNSKRRSAVLAASPFASPTGQRRFSTRGAASSSQRTGTVLPLSPLPTCQF